MEIITAGCVYMVRAAMAPSGSLCRSEGGKQQPEASERAVGWGAPRGLGLGRRVEAGVPGGHSVLMMALQGQVVIVPIRQVRKSRLGQVKQPRGVKLGFKAGVCAMPLLVPLGPQPQRGGARIRDSKDDSATPRGPFWQPQANSAM